MQLTPQWTRYERAFEYGHIFDDPAREAEVWADFTSENGKVHTVSVFWDGESMWRVRYSPDELGRWRYRTRSLHRRGVTM